MLLLVTILAVDSVWMQSGGAFQIEKSVIAGGGGRSAGGAFTLNGTIAQSVAGTNSSGGGFQVAGGFWGAGGTTPVSNATISGRVTTPAGLGLRNAVVTIIDPAGVRRNATTSSFGLYSFDNIVPGQTYILTVASKRFRFTPLMMPINGSLTSVDFAGLE